MHSSPRIAGCAKSRCSEVLVTAASLVLLLFGSAARGINYDWNGSIDSDWLNGSNWTPAGPPQGGDGNFARFFTGRTRAASITADTPVVQDILSGNDGTAGLRQIDHSAGTVNLNGWMRLGFDPDGAGPISGAGDAGTYNMTGGVINAGSYRIGEVAGSSVTANLSGTALFNQRDTNPAEQGAWSRIGEFGATTFNISGNAMASFDSRLMIGAGRSSAVTVNQTGGTLEVRRGELVISDTGGTDAQPITYNISAGTLRTLAPGPDEDQGGNITIGQWENSRGLLKASGTATVHAARDIQLAVGTNIGSPTGTLTILDNASVTFGRRLMSGKQYDGGGAGGDNGGIINFNLSGNGVFRQDDVLDLAAESNWNFFAHNPTSVANVNITGGQMSFDSRTFFSRDGSGTYNQSGGTVEVRRGELDIADGGSAIYNLSGGTLRTLSSEPIVIGRWQNSDGQMNVSAAGVLNAGGDLVLGQGDDAVQVPMAKGTLTQTGGQVVVTGNLQMATASLATGIYNLQGGVLDLTNGEINRGLGMGSFNFTGGRLRNAAAINLPLNQQGGILAPGATASAGTTAIKGNYSLQSAGTIEISIISPLLVDRINVTGTVSLAGNLQVTDDAPGLAIGSSLVILNNDGTDPITGTFTGLPEGRDFSSGAGNIFDISYVGGDGNDVRLLVVVPEPTTVSMLLAGAGLFVSRRARRS